MKPPQGTDNPPSIPLQPVQPEGPRPSLPGSSSTSAVGTPANTSPDNPRKPVPDSWQGDKIQLIKDVLEVFETKGAAAAQQLRDTVNDLLSRP